jgi:hypothetical protein
VQRALSNCVYRSAGEIAEAEEVTLLLRLAEHSGGVSTTTGQQRNPAHLPK